MKMNRKNIYIISVILGLLILLLFGYGAYLLTTLIPELSNFKAILFIYILKISIFVIAFYISSRVYIFLLKPITKRLLTDVDYGEIFKDYYDNLEKNIKETKKEENYH